MDFSGKAWQLLICESTPRTGLGFIIGQNAESIETIVSRLEEIKDPSDFVDTAITLLRKTSLAKGGSLLKDEAVSLFDDEVVDSLERSVRKIIIKRITQAVTK